MADRDPITCHVLNTLSGTPASGLNCTLTLLRVSSPVNQSFPPCSFHSVTDSDGRIKNWTPTSTSDPTCHSLRAYMASLGTSHATDTLPIKTAWSLKFEGVDRWYEEKHGVESFWPEVEVKFVVGGVEGQEGWRHYHVPVLLGPWNYSTYRGS